MKNRQLRSFLIPWLLAAAPAALLGGCLGPSRLNPENTYKSSEGRHEVDQSIGDRDLERKFVLLGTRTERRDGRLFVQFELKNTTTAEQRIEWCLEWLDPSDFRIDSVRSWTPAVVGGGGVIPIQATAPVQSASGFKLRLRRPSPIR
jgi:hypothetical protein